MENRFEIQGNCLIIHLPKEVDHMVTDEIRRDSDGSLIADPITLAAGASVSSITLKEAPEYGNAACTATVTATRDGKTVGTLEVKTALHAAYLWPKEVMSK